MDPTRAENHLTLLSIRVNGRKRAAFITGGVFVIFFLATVFLDLSGQLSGRSLTIVGALLAVFGISFLMSWVRLEITREAIELIENIQE